MPSQPNKLTRGYSQYPSVPIPERWPIDPRMNTRSAEADGLDKDARLINAYATVDPEDGLLWIEKRPGFSDGNLHTPSGNGLGIYNWLEDIYSVFGTKLFKDNIPFADVLDNGSVYRFQQVLGATPKLVLKNLTQGWFTDGAALTQITDVDYPTPTVVGIAYLDGTLYVMDPNGAIFGSGIDDPSTWTALNKIVARNEPDKGVAIIKHQTYIVALKQWSTQAFYNAGNATGSPLSRVDGFMSFYGCRNGNSVRDIDGVHFWISANRAAGSQVVMLDNLQLSVISTPVIDRLVTRFGNSSFAYTIKLGGKKFYCLALSTFILVYDVDQKFWYRWTDSTGTAIWPFVDATFSGDQTIVQHVANGKSYLCDTDFSLPTDDGALIPVDIYTNNFDFGTNRIKNLNFMTFIADIVNGSILQVRNSDNDFNSWTNFRLVDLGQNRPSLDKNGSFYQRAYHFRHQKATPFRIKAVDIQIDIGTG